MALKEENARLRSQLDRAKEALKFYAAGRHLWNESEKRPGNICPPIGHYAQQALEAIERMEREGK